MIEPAALYEQPFTALHGGGPDALFAGKNHVINGIFEQIESVRNHALKMTGTKSD